MAAALTDYFLKVGANTVTTLAAPGKNLAAPSITVGSTTNYPTDTGIIIAIRVVDAEGKLVAGTYTEWKAIVASATTLTIDPTPVFGNDQVYAAAATTQVFIPTSAYAQSRLMDGLLVGHNQDGSHKAVVFLGYAQATSNQASITTETDLTSLSVTVTVPAGGRRVKITGYTSVSNTGTAGRTTMYIKEGATYLQQFSVHNAVASSSATLNAQHIYVPSAGSHTYKLSMEANAGTSNTGAAATSPAFILVELL